MHPLLERQIQRYLGTAEKLGDCRAFIEAVGAAYEQGDSDRQLIERSLELMSRELNERNTALRNELAEKQRAEAQLEHLLSLFNTALESVADGILALNREGKILRFNQHFVDMWNIPDEILLFWDHHQMIGQMRLLLEDLAHFLTTLEYLCRHPEVEHYNLLQFRDGRMIELYSLPQPLGVDIVGRVIGFRDVTERKHAEAALLKEKEEQAALIKKLEAAHNQLLQSEKMASIGQLAAGVAHEINNPVGYVSSNLGTLEGYIASLLRLIDAYGEAEPAIQDAGLQESLREARAQADLDYLKEDVGALMGETRDGLKRVKQIVQDLKDFSRVDSSDEWQKADLHRGLDSTLNVVWNEIKYKAEVDKRYGDLPDVECLPSQLNQVFMNLMVNAAHAIDGRGRITLSTGREGEEVWVKVSDTGKGIAPEHMARIFDPFFTTKPVGKGTGLGLSLAYGIVQKHHGRIEVESEPGKGTEFTVWLPVSQAGFPSEPEATGA